MRWVEHVARVSEIKVTCSIFVGIPQRKKSLGDLSIRNIKVINKDIRYELDPTYCGQHPVSGSYEDSTEHWNAIIVVGE
jgi:hypothetical protein